MLRLAVRVDRERSELVLAELLELAPGGVEEVDVSESVVEYAVYGSPGELPALPEVRAAAAGALVDVSTSEVADDWAQRWRSFHRPLVLGDRLVVRPPWEPAAIAAIDVVIDPGQAFGTGAHATTRLCLQMIEARRSRLDGRPFVDLGCGSGVLAIVAGRLGATPVGAFDFDPLAVAATVANAEVNGVSLAASRLDLRCDPLPEMNTETVVAANLLGPLLRLLAVRLGEDAAQAPGMLLAGGLLDSEANEIAEAFASAAGLEEVQRRSSEGWSALALASPRGQRARR